MGFQSFLEVNKIKPLLIPLLLDICRVIRGMLDAGLVGSEVSSVPCQTLGLSARLGDDLLAVGL